MTAARMPTALLILPGPDLACMTIFLGAILIRTMTCLLFPTRVIFSFRRNGRFVRSTHVDLHLKSQALAHPSTQFRCRAELSDCNRLSVLE